MAAPVRLANATTMTTTPQPGPGPAASPAPPAGTIRQRAATSESEQLWKADSRGYQLAGRWHFVRVTVTLGFAFLAPVITFFWPASADGVAAAAGAWLLISRTVFSGAELRERRRAVTAQERFDTQLFGLPWNLSLAGRPPAEEDIHSAAAKYGRPGAPDWYPDTEDVPWPLDVLLCQRSSAVWGRRTHQVYAIVIGVFGAAILLTGVAIAVLANLSTTDYLVRLFLPSVPALLDTIDLARTHWQTAAEKKKIEDDSDDLWNKALQDPSNVTLLDCRRLQDQSYRLRLDGPRVAYWLYRIRRNTDEQAMQNAVASRVRDFHTHYT